MGMMVGMNPVRLALLDASPFCSQKGEGSRDGSFEL